MTQHIIARLRGCMDRTIIAIYALVIEDHAYAHVTRLAIAFLDLWQAIILINHNYWIPQLLDFSAPLYYYTVFITALSILATLSLLLSRMLVLSLITLGVNFILYLALGIAGLWYSDPPRASSGFAFFVMLISISAFWRISSVMIRNRVNRKR